MSKITGLDFSSIENSYDNNLNRADAEILNSVGTVDLGQAVDSDDYINRELSGGKPKEEKNVQGQDLENIWISSWIKSRSYLPGRRGFLIDGKTGFIECAKLKVRGTGEIGGWNIDATRIYSDDDELILDSSVPKIESGNYVSGYAGAGVHLSPNLLEVGNIACRGIFRSAVMQYNNTFAYAGNQIVAKGADVLSVDMTVADNSTIEIENDSEASAWAVGDILQLDDANDTEWLEITSVSGNVYTCNRDKKGDYGAGANPAWKKGQAVVNYGQSSDGGIYMTASESNAPYLSIFTHSGSPWTDLTTRLRIGKLDGYLGYPVDGDKYGIGIGDTTKYLKYDPTNGLRLKGNFERNDFHWVTLFESLDGFSNSGATLSAVDLTLTTGATTNDTASVVKRPSYNFSQLTWDKDRKIRTRVRFSQNTNQTIWIVCGNDGIDRHIGFKIIDNVLYGTVANGTSESTLNCGNISTASIGMALEARLEAGTEVEFFIGDVSQGTIDTNIPSGTIIADSIVSIIERTDEDVAKTIRLSFWDFWQGV